MVTILLTGRRGVGKTTVCQAVAELARRRGYRPGGVITPALYDSHGAKVGFEAVDVGSGERWPLARTDPSTTLRRGSGCRRELDTPRVGPYSFAPAALARAIRVLRRACPERGSVRRPAPELEAATTGCDLLMVDEIGPLELEQGEGFAPILELLPVEGPTHTFIVVRPALLDQLMDTIGRSLAGYQPALCRAECVVFSVTEANRDELPLRIVEELWGFSSGLGQETGPSVGIHGS
jgi:nucleoside-triphosphatase THEP1